MNRPFVHRDKLVPVLHDTLQAAEALIESDGRRHCAQARVCPAATCQSKGMCAARFEGWTWSGGHCAKTQINCELVQGSCELYPTRQACESAKLGCLP
jgi:hypothetical protein